MKNQIAAYLFIGVSLTIVSCSTGKQSREIDALTSHIDSTVNPADDFFDYANGKWFKEHPIPANEASNGIFQLIQDTINEQVLDICTSSAAATSVDKGSNRQKIGDFYLSGMDSIGLNKRGISDIKKELDQIDLVKDLDGIAKSASLIQTVSRSPLFRFGIGQDDKISSKNAVFISQGGLSLPDRSNYFDMDPRAVAIRQKFIIHLANAFMIMGIDEYNAKKAADAEMKLETALARISRKSEDTRDPIKNYNKITFMQLNKIAPDFNWNSFFENSGLHNVDTVIIAQPEFLKGLNGYLTTYPLSEWKNYLKYQLIRGLSSYMDDKTFMEFFSFYSNTLVGISEPKPRWKRVVGQTDGSLGELIGQVYVDNYLPKGTKEKLIEIGTVIKQVYEERIKKLDWMSESTKEKATDKLRKIIMKVGYPDKWKDLSTLQVDRSSYIQNVMNARKWYFNYMISKFGKPVDRTEWAMQPQTYNAYYNPSNNEICVPGCNIIVPGFERTMADDALLYSIIGGSTFGHEITHGFDDQGSKYDEFGNLNNWWTPADSIKFYSKTRLIIDQFNGYIAVDSLHINGSLTQGENIADLGGIMMGYEAFKKTKQYMNHEIIAGLSPNKRFFLGYALAWMVNERPEMVANQVRSDFHSPVKFRVIGPLSDIPEFYSSFGVREGNKMWRPDSLRVVIW
jgi:putative endopeptidase